MILTCIGVSILFFRFHPVAPSSAQSGMLYSIQSNKILLQLFTQRCGLYRIDNSVKLHACGFSFVIFVSILLRVNVSAKNRKKLYRTNILYSFCLIRPMGLRRYHSFFRVAGLFYFRPVASPPPHPLLRLRFLTLTSVDANILPSVCAGYLKQPLPSGFVLNIPKWLI